ncbi:ArsR/SmtB family transcription factor [Cellulomonas sp. NPDC057328]|uniref:ArsR/SmtB family transcription factor n=1 Tax=Cellulomonas sp. NPDC057328 TaxID=3346101 RepID=UPI00363DDA45
MSTAARRTDATPAGASAPHVDAVLAALAEPVRRRLMERLAVAECAAGDLVALARAEFGISQPATSQHLRVLREAGVVTVRADGSRRLYAADAAALAVVGDWLRAFQDPFAQPLDALATELARGRRRTRASGASIPADPPAAGTATA